MDLKSKIILIYGPTASGKSTFSKLIGIIPPLFVFCQTLLLYYKKPDNFFSLNGEFANKAIDKGVR